MIKHADDAELTYVSNQSEWDSDADLRSATYDEADYLVDAAGEIHALVWSGDKRVVPQSKGECMALPAVLELVKAHAAQSGACCVAKLSAPTIVAALHIVASLHDD